MCDVEIPLSPIRDMNIAVWPMGVGNLVDLHARWKHIDNNSIIERYDARAELFASNKLGMGRIHGEEITLHPNEIAFVAFDGSNKVTLRVTLEKLSMNDVNVFPSINDHNERVPRVSLKGSINDYAFLRQMFRLGSYAERDEAAAGSRRQ